MKNHTEVSVENNWLRLFRIDSGYEVYLKTFAIEGKRQTIAVDNFSVSPVSVLDYDLEEVNLDLVEWENVWDKDIHRFERYPDGLHALKSMLNETDYRDVEALYVENYA